MCKKGISLSAFVEKLFRTVTSYLKSLVPFILSSRKVYSINETVQQRMSMGKLYFIYRRFHVVESVLAVGI